MANKEEKQKQKNVRRINKLTDFVQNSLDTLYSKTFFSSPSNKSDLNKIKDKLDDSIDNIVSTNKDNTGGATMSTLYSRIQDINGTDGEAAKQLEQLLNDNSVIESGLLGFVNNTTTIFDYDNKIDTIIKYMPKLQEALDWRKENVLSADHFSKDYINITSSNLNNNSASYNEHIKEVKEKYNIQELVDEIYDKASKYGEAFVYIVPYKKAVTRLLKNKNSIRGDLNIKESKIVTESGSIVFDDTPSGISKEDLIKSGLGNIVIECNRSGAIDSIIESQMRYEKAYKLLNEMSLNYEGAELSNESLQEAAENVRDVIKGQFDRTIKDDLSFKGFDDLGQDGLIDKNKVKK